MKRNFFNLEEIINIGFEKCEEHNTKIWGIYPIDNGYFMKDTISTDLKFIQGTLQGIICDYASSPFMLWNEDNCEDFARTLHYYTLYESIIRINYIAPKTKFAKTKGGLQSVYGKDERLKLEKEAMKKLELKYPHLCKVMPKKNGRDTLKLHHYKAFKNSVSLTENTFGVDEKMKKNEVVEYEKKNQSTS